MRHNYDGDRCRACGCNWMDVSYWLTYAEDTCPADYALVVQRRDGTAAPRRLADGSGWDDE